MAILEFKVFALGIYLDDSIHVRQEYRDESSRARVLFLYWIYLADTYQTANPTRADFGYWIYLADTTHGRHKCRLCRQCSLVEGLCFDESSLEQLLF